MESEEQTTNSQANSAEGESQQTPPAGADSGAGAESQGTQQTQASPSEQKVSPEAYRKLQSEADRAKAEVERIRRESEKAIADAREAGRQATLATLKPEEREAQIRAWRLEDRERELEAAEREQEQTARALAITKLTMDYGLDDEARAALEGIDDVNEMRARAAELRVETLQRELEAAKAGAGQSQTSTESQKTPAAMRQTPEGSGGGTQQGAYDPNKYKRTGDIAGSLRAQREAGLVKYEKVTPGGRR